VCTQGLQITVGQCTAGAIFIEGFSTEGAYITKEYTTSDCSGAEKIDNIYECEFCYGGAGLSSKVECNKNEWLLILIIVGVVVVIVGASIACCCCCCCKSKAPQTTIVVAGAPAVQPVMVAGAGPQVVQMQPVPGQPVPVQSTYHAVQTAPADCAAPAEDC
jgi:hypothetical protein